MTNEKMLISVIIPCYNVEAYIEECVNSVLAQTYQSFEIILVNNNSSDQTSAILDRLLIENPDRVKVLNEAKPGAPFARNAGLKQAKGEWIQFLDADDLIKPNKLEHQVKMIKDNSSLIIGFSEKLSVNGRLKVMEAIDEPFLGLMKTQFGNTCANLWNASLVKSVNGWNEDLKSSQEYNLMFEVLKRNQEYVFDTAVNTTIRERESGQISQNDPKPRWNTYVDLRVRILSFLKSEKQDYFVKNEQELKQVLFDAVRTYAQYDLPAAISIHDKFLKGFIPTASGATSSNYIRLYKLLGFKGAEKIKGLFKKA